MEATQVQPITLTEKAASELSALMKDQQKESSALRVWVAGGGCSGLSYGMALDAESPEADDVVFEQFGVRVIVDSLSLSYMQGSVVDFVDDELGGGFKVENPNATNTCGCGSSFQTEGEAGAGGCGGCGGH